MVGRNPEKLLNKLEDILDSDPLINEVQFVPPSQFVTLGVSETQDLSVEIDFWCKDHKLFISTEILYPLYNEATDTFMATYEIFKKRSCCSSSLDVLETDIMKHSKVVLLQSHESDTAWDCRKLVLSNKDNIEVLMDELLFSALILSCARTSECSWSHRRWVIQKIAGRCLESLDLQKIVEKETDLVERIAEKSKINYQTWNYRCWLVSFMSREQARIDREESQLGKRARVDSERSFAHAPVAEDLPREYEPKDMPALIFRRLASIQRAQMESAALAAQDRQDFRALQQQQLVMHESYVDMHGDINAMMHTQQMVYQGLQTLHPKVFPPFPGPRGPPGPSSAGDCEADGKRAWVASERSFAHAPVAEEIPIEYDPEAMPALIFRRLGSIRRAHMEAAALAAQNRQDFRALQQQELVMHESYVDMHGDIRALMHTQQMMYQGLQTLHSRCFHPEYLLAQAGDCEADG